MANILQNQYKSVFSEKSTKLQGDHLTDKVLNDIFFGTEDVIEAIMSIKLNAAPGPDGFPVMLLQKCKDELAPAIVLLWRNCLNDGMTPLLLKTNYIIPIYKGGDQGDPANYRPVSLTSHLAKIFEKIVRKKMVEYLEHNNLLNDSQHGFRRGRSCLTQLLTHYDTLMTYLEKGHNVDTVYLDFSKAFDKVDHSIIIRKLQSLGIGGKLIKWIYSFLCGREQIVIVNGEKSNKVHIKSGVPQGSVLGPLIFILMIGDIDTDITYSFLPSFADDTRLMKVIEDTIDTFKLQHDLNVVYKWAEANKMKLNGKKFEQLSFGKNTQKIKQSVYFDNQGKQIASKETVRDLGVIMDVNGTFTTHINKLISKVNELSGWILRTFQSREKDVLLTLWKSLVIPHLDYCSPLWSPVKTSLIQKIEMTQKAFIRNIKGMKKLNYWEQLKYLGLYSLERRRGRFQIIYI